jgi:two-component system, LytTR family, response regulator LytT
MTSQLPDLLRVLAVDDEPPALSELEYLLSEFSNIGTLTTASCPSEVHEALSTAIYDVVLLDIEMGEESGLQVAAQIRALPADRCPAVIFVTAYGEHAVQAFELDAVDYVLKPVRRDRLAQALQRVAERRGRQSPAATVERTTTIADSEVTTLNQSRIPIDLGGKTVFVERSSVTIVEASRDYVKLHARVEMGTKTYLFRAPISSLETAWASAGFLRVHRGYLVSLADIRELRSDSHGTSILVSGLEIPVGRTYLRVLKDRLLGGS